MSGYSGETTAEAVDRPMETHYQTEPLDRVVGEHSGKFMVDQHVLSGSASITPPDRARVTYRNFFPLGGQWVLAGVRLAKSA